MKVFLLHIPYTFLGHPLKMAFLSESCYMLSDYGILSSVPGTKGRNKGEFTNLQGVAASATGTILIADSNNQCVQVRDGCLSKRDRFEFRNGEIQVQPPQSITGSVLDK